MEQNIQIALSNSNGMVLLDEQTDEFIEINDISIKHITSNSIVISKLSDNENISFLVNTNTNHLIGMSDILLNELSIVKKIISNGCFHISDFMQNEINTKKIEISHSKDISDKTEELLTSLDYTKSFESPKDNLRIVLNELLTNAFFHQEDLIDKDRKNSVFTSDLKPITASIAQDDKSILIYVKDNIGTISRDNVINSIHRAQRERAPKSEGHGAGLGMAMVFENLNQLHIHKKENQYCEYYGVIDISRRYKKFKERVTSFHFFEEK